MVEHLLRSFDWVQTPNTPYDFASLLHFSGRVKIYDLLRYIKCIAQMIIFRLWKTSVSPCWPRLIPSDNPPSANARNSRFTTKSSSTSFSVVLVKYFVLYSHGTCSLLKSCTIGDSCSDATHCSNGGFADPGQCSQCVCPDGFSGVSCDEAPSPNSSMKCACKCTYCIYRYACGEPL